MSKYKLGIMSNVWEVEAPDVDTAVVALRLWGEYATIPIANYSDGNQSKFMNLLGATDQELQPLRDFIKGNTQNIKKTISSISEVES